MGKYEFSSVPRSLFHEDGSLNLCQQKSKLVDLLMSGAENPFTQTNENKEQIYQTGSSSTKSLETDAYVAIVDGMAELQALQKSKDMATCKDLAEAFTSKVFAKYGKYDEIYMIFDSYVKNSIKAITREKRLHGIELIQFKIMDSTVITNVTMKKLLSHPDTKDELSAYISEKVFHHAGERNVNLVVTWREEIASTHCDLGFLKSTQEEADTKMILHAVNAKERGANRLFFFTPDTDVLILAVRRWPELPSQSFFMPTLRTEISIADIFSSLGPLKSSALPAFHCLSGCDTTGALVGKGKLSYWKAFNTATEKTLTALAALGTSEEISEGVLKEIEKFICQVYKPGSSIDKLAELRWYLFSKKNK